MVRSTKKKIIVFGCMLTFAAALSACGRGQGEIPKESGGIAGNEGSTGKGEAEEEKKDYIQENATGRFLESELTLPDYVEQVLDMQVLSDGKIALLDRDGGYYVSEDGGETFQPKDVPAFFEQRQKYYIAKGTIGKDGSLVLECYSMNSVQSEGAGSEAVGEDENTDSAENAEMGFAAVTANDGQEDEDAGEQGDSDQIVMMDGTEASTRYVHIDAQGNAVVCEEMDRIGYANHLMIAEDGRIFAAADGIYELDFSAKQAVKLCDTKNTAEYMQRIGDKLYILEYGELEIYDMSAKEMAEDEILKQFAGEDEMSGSGTEGAYPMLLYPGDTEDTIYVASSQGVFRHVMGGSVMEEVIKGSLSCMGAPSYALSDMMQVSKDCFLVLYNMGTLKKYLYDPEASAVPENEVKVYSLKENDAVRTAINLYQNEHPDTYLEYEVGMTGQDGETVQDAVRSLNTSLLDGDGPDILILDGLPMQSYLEKGILEDLTDCLPDGSKLYEKIVRAYEKDGTLCGMPVLFEMPLIAGEDVANVDSLAALADYVEKKRSGSPEGSITGSYMERSVLNRLYDVSAAGFIREDGSLDEEKLTEYLTLSKRIWDADLAGIADEQKETYRDIMTEVNEGTRLDPLDYEVYVSSKGMDLISGQAKIVFGRIRGIAWDYSDLTSTFYSLKKEAQIRTLNGLSENVFVPSTILSVTKSSDVKDAAKEFVKSMLSEETQKTLVENRSGLPVNRQALLSEEARYEPGEELGGYAMSDQDGAMFGMDIVWPSKEELELLNSAIEELATPAYLNDTIKGIVLEQGVPALKGEKSIEDAVKEILNSVQIYLAE